MDRILKKNYYKIIEFMCMCNNQERNYIRKLLVFGEVIEEQHIRLIAMARAFDNYPVWNLLVSSYKDWARLQSEYVKKISSNRNILYDWADSFIENIEAEDLKKYAQIYWRNKVELIEQKKVGIRDIFYGKWK